MKKNKSFLVGLSNMSGYIDGLVAIQSLMQDVQGSNPGADKL